MIFNNPYKYQQYYNNYYKNFNKQNGNLLKPYNTVPTLTSQDKNFNVANNLNDNLSKKTNKSNDTEYIDILGIKLRYDDILLILLIYFLYSENVKDMYLFFILILLLLS